MSTSIEPTSTEPPAPTGPTSPAGPSDLVVAAAISTAMGAFTGMGAGLLWGGIGGRIAMRVLFLTTGDHVAGLTSDDGFEIGRISGDSIFLILAMTVLGGFLGAVLGLARMLFRGPPWLVAGGVAVALGAGAGGGAIVSTEGIDFRLLEPLWLAVGLFVFLPAAWGMTVILATDKLLHHPNIGATAMPAVDARPLGRVGDLIGWAGLIAITVIGSVDLIADIRVLT